MIPRYALPRMSRIWGLENKYEIWREIEVLACEAHVELGSIGITAADAERIRAKASFDVARVEELERVTNHDVIAFLTNMAEHIDAGLPEGEPKPSRWVHYGMTSSDLGDTALSLQMVQAVDALIEGVRRIGRVCKRRALETRSMVCVGRTHGIHAEPMTMGMKFGRWAWAMHRALGRLSHVRDEVAFGAISGAVGTYSNIDPFVEEYVAQRLGLAQEPLSTQVIPRDRHAYFLSVLATVAASAEEIATEVRALQKTDTLEAEEPFASGQKGSSAMPHKRNPIIAERVCGLSRVVKAYAIVGLDNVALWHERDISHSSAERVVLADATIALDYLLDRLAWILEGLVLYPERMRANLESTRGLVYSSRVLLELVDAGFSREEAYAVVQRHAMAVWDDIQHVREGPTLRERLEADSACASVRSRFDDVFDPSAFLDRIGVVFERVERLEFEEPHEA